MVKGIPHVRPIRLPKGIETLLVFGGSFDPPHAGHELASLTSLAGFDTASTRVLLVPAARSPHKTDGPRATDRQRVAMARLLMKDWAAHVMVWTDEIDRALPGEPSYTIDTLRRLRRAIPSKVKLRLLIGSDQAAAFHRWRAPRAIVRLAEPLVLRRKPVTTARALRAAMDHAYWTPEELSAWEGRLAHNVVVTESSTAVRWAIRAAPRDVRRWKSIAGLDGIPIGVARYIVAHSLYGFGTAKNPTGQRGSRVVS